MEKEYFFDNIDDLIAYLYTKVDNLSPLKLQKGLYFLYAYYAAMYGTKHERNEESEIDYELPKELFPAKFEAWTYGPVIRSVYIKRRDNEDEYKEKARNFNNNFFSNRYAPYGDEVKSFIDDLFSQINQASDFSLVDRSHSDKAWEDAFNEGKSTIMNKESIINEYKNKFTRKRA
jgi:orf24